MDGKNDMVANMATLLTRGGLWRSSFLGILEPSDKIWPQETPT